MFGGPFTRGPSRIAARAEFVLIQIGVTTICSTKAYKGRMTETTDWETGLLCRSCFQDVLDVHYANFDQPPREVVRALPSLQWETLIRAPPFMYNVPEARQA